MRALAPWLGVLLSGLAACGLDVVGTSEPPKTTAVDASAPDVAAAPEAEAGSSVSTGAFCDTSDATLIACFRFEGAVLDESAHAQKVDVTGSPAFVPGVRGSAVSLTASTTLHVPHNAAWTFDALSVEMWIRPRSLPGDRAGLLDKDGSFGIFVQSNGDVTCGDVRAPNAAVVGRWSHIACTNGGGRVAISVDGVSVEEASSSKWSPGTALAAIGGDSPSGDPFSGEIDELRVFSRARTASEVALAATK